MSGSTVQVFQLSGTYLFSVVVFVTDVERQEAESDGNLALELFTVKWTEGKNRKITLRVPEKLTRAISN